MRAKNISSLLLSVFLAISCMLSGCQMFTAGKIKITGIKMAQAIDKDIMPVNPVDIFAKGTSRVYCWFSWQGAKTGTQIIAKWYFTSEDVNIVGYPFNVPRRNGAGSVSLSMPEGKAFPAGSYRVDLTLNNRVLKYIEFKVE